MRHFYCFQFSKYGIRIKLDKKKCPRGFALKTKNPNKSKKCLSGVALKLKNLEKFGKMEKKIGEIWKKILKKCKKIFYIKMSFTTIKNFKSSQVLLGKEKQKILKTGFKYNSIPIFYDEKP